MVTKQEQIARTHGPKQDVEEKKTKKKSSKKKSAKKKTTEKKDEDTAFAPEE